MSRVTLDTSGYSAFKRGHAGVVAHLRRAEEILLPTIVLGELLGGFEAGRRARRNREELDLFRASPRVRLVPIGEATADRYAVIYAGLRSSGQPIPTNDLWIAASVMEHATRLVTLDRDFSRVAQILVTLYEP
jgi:predicted nucleic acid-binding protein